MIDNFKILSVVYWNYDTLQYINMLVIIYYISTYLFLFIFNVPASLAFISFLLSKT